MVVAEDVQQGHAPSKPRTVPILLERPGFDTAVYWDVGAQVC